MSSGMVRPDVWRARRSKGGALVRLVAGRMVVVLREENRSLSVRALEWRITGGGPRTDEVTPPTAAVRARMQRTRSSDGELERRLRRELTALGVRYRLQLRAEPDLRHRADFVFKGARVVVDVRGCFWHACPLHATWPKRNAVWWRDKLRRNAERDERVVAELRSRGWLVVVVWQHDDFVTAASEVRQLLEARRPARSRRRGDTPTDN